MSTYLPAKIGKYDVVGLIGRGAKGIVYDGVDPDIDRRVAITTIAGTFPQNADILNCFTREAQSAGGLHHPNVIDIYDVVVHEGNPYIVMEYLEGESLDAALKCGREFSLLDKISIVIRVCHGLAYSHRCGIAHHDIKPANIMLCNDGGIKIFNFGIAPTENQTIIRTAEVTDALRYMAPEQVNSGSADYKADIFSTGVVLYELITNHPLFEGQNTASTILKIAHEPPTRLNMLLSSYPAEIEPILLRAMARNPQDRYVSADDFAVDLERLQRQLKEELVSGEMQEVSSRLDRDELSDAQRFLLRGRNVENHQSSAIRLLGDVQRRIQQYEVSDPVFGLWVQAEIALAERHFDEAQNHAEHALALDPDDADLQQLRETIRAEAARTERLQRFLDMAQAAQADGNLDAAREAVEQAMEVAPDNAEAKAMYQLISREILERARQRQIEEYLRDARQEISGGKFNVAIEILRRAEELDPNAPGVQSLIQLAVLGEQQERRRTEIESFSSEIQYALTQDDYRTAIRKSDEALARYPQERIFVHLKEQAEVQLQTAERKRVLDADLAAARELLQAGRTKEVKERLEKILMLLGSEPQLQSPHISPSAERYHQPMDQESEALQKTVGIPSHQVYDDAIEAPQARAKVLDENSELSEMLNGARSEQADLVQTVLYRADQEPELSQSKIILETALLKLPNERQLREKLTQVNYLNEMVSKTVGEAGRLEGDGKYDLALAKWEVIRVLHPRHPDLNPALKRIRDLQQCARGDSRQTWIDRIETALRISEYTEALAIVGKALREFPWDSDLIELRERTELAIRQRAKAEKLLMEAQGLLSKQKWKAGARALVRAYQAGPEDSLIRNQVVVGLSRASSDAMEKDHQAAEAILQELIQIEPAGAGITHRDQHEEQVTRPAVETAAASANSDVPSEPHRAGIPTNVISSSHATGAPAELGRAESIRASQVPRLGQEMLLPSNVLIDNLHFTFTAPGSLLRGGASLIQFWVHAEEQTETLLERARDLHPSEDVDTRKSVGAFPMQRGARIGVRLKLGNGLTCLESHKWIKWTGNIGNANFAVTVPSEVSEGDLIGLASVRLNGCQVAKLSFLLNIGSKMQAVRLIPCQKVMHRRAFASYDSSDRDEVLARVQDMEAAYKGLRVYVDAVTLRSATYWEPGLHASIDNADVFYLFWCRHAMVSDWVHREWRWALRSRGLDFIDPVPLESPEKAPPPAELAARDFTDLFSGTGSHPA